MKSNVWIAILAIILIVISIVVLGGKKTEAPGSGKENKKEASTPQVSPTVMVATREAEGGSLPYLTDAAGKTLYFFTKDADGKSACIGECLQKWPAFSPDKIEVAQGLELGDFGTITLADNSLQVTYKGWPLYYFAQDQNPGDMKGEAVNNVWFVARTDYDVMVATTKENKNYLTDVRGRTIYYFTKDTKGASNCSGDCIAKWPIFDSQEPLVAPSVVAKVRLGNITRADGKRQSTYDGMPLYYFADDALRGETKGDGVNKVWYLVDPQKGL